MQAFNSKAALKELRKLNLSEGAFSVVEKIGVKRITKLVREGNLLTEFETQCCNWVEKNRPLMLSMYDLVSDNHLYTENDVYAMLCSIPIDDIISVIDSESYDTAPRIVKAIIDVSEDDHRASLLEDCSFIGVGSDYLEEIEEYVCYSSFY